MEDVLDEYHALFKGGQDIDGVTVARCAHARWHKWIERMTNQASGANGAMIRDDDVGKGPLEG